MWEPVALCCFSRRTGCLVLGSLEVIGAAIGVIVAVILLIASDSLFYNVVCTTTYMQNENCVENLRLPVYTALAITLIIGLVQLVCASMMIHGVRTNNHCLMCPYLIKNLIAVTLNIIFGSLGVAFLCVMNFPLMIPVAYCYGALIFMWTYFLLTVRAYYHELKRGKADDHHRLVENSELEIGVVNKL